MSNNSAILIVGGASSGKSTSLHGLENKDKWNYFNTDMKDLPIRGNFQNNIVLQNAEEILSYIPQLEASEKAEGVILDTLTFLMEMYERQVVQTSPPSKTMQAWAAYGKFYGDMMHMIKGGSKPYIIMAHEKRELNESTMQMESKIPVKGAVGARGIDADFSIVVTAKRVQLKELEGIKNDMLTITEDDEYFGYKHVFQVLNGKNSEGERTRAPLGMWKRNEMFIDNNVQHILNRVKEYYGN